MIDTVVTLYLNINCLILIAIVNDEGIYGPFHLITTTWKWAERELNIVGQVLCTIVVAILVLPQTIMSCILYIIFAFFELLVKLFFAIFGKRY